jgi:hypothetical protein
MCPCAARFAPRHHPFHRFPVTKLLIVEPPAGCVLWVGPEAMTAPQHLSEASVSAMVVMQTAVICRTATDSFVKAPESHSVQNSMMQGRTLHFNELPGQKPKRNP